MDRLKLINRATAITVGLVATFAAVISYTHIYSLARMHRELVIDAALLPLITDGLILAASLVLIYVAWQKLPVPWLARVTLWVGIGATIVANVAYGLPGGRIDAILASWPAAAFILTVETAMQLAKTKRVRAKKQDSRVVAVANGGKTIAEYPGYRPNIENRVKIATLMNGEVPAPTLVVPSIRTIRQTLSPCGQPRAQQIQEIIRKQGCGILEADKIRKEVKLNV